MFKHLLVPTDGSPLAQAAVARAISFAHEAGAKITFLCAEHHSPAMYLGLGAITDGQAIRQFNAEEDSVAQKILQQSEQLAMESGVSCDTLALVSSEPYEAIIAAAGRVQADVIFMAAWIPGRQSTDTGE